MKIIILGAGEVGFHIAQRLSEEKQDVLLIDKDPVKINRINENLDVQAIDKDPVKINRINENLDVQAILGSGTSPEILKRSGIKESDMLVAATDSDEVNLFACMLAKNMNPYIVKIARVRNQEYINEKDLLGEDLLGIDQIINPGSVMVDTVRGFMLAPGASDVIDFVDGRVKLIGITIKSDSPLAGRKLLSFKGVEGKVLIGAIIRGDKVFIPRGEDTIEPNDLVYAVVQTSALESIFPFFDIQGEECKRVMIVGAGETGLALAKALDQGNINTKIFERDSGRCTVLAEQLERVIVINGDGTDKQLLQEENIKDIDFMVAVTGDEESNVLISLLAKQLGAKKTITRISKLSYIPLVSAIGIDTVVSPRLSAIRAILQYIRRGKIISVAPLKGEHAEAIEAEALDTSEIVNKPLSKVKFPKGALIGAIVRNQDIIIPKGDSIVLPQDRLIIFTLDKVVPKLEKLLTVKLEYF